ncbi:MAG TPA: hypothetical protein VF677_09745 [Flavobacterium sp.]|jgi:hypothetical protein
METTTDSGTTGQGSQNDNRNRKAEEAAIHDKVSHQEEEEQFEPGEPGSGQGKESSEGKYNPSGKSSDNNSHFDGQHMGDKNAGMGSKDPSKNIGKNKS